MPRQAYNRRRALKLGLAVAAGSVVSTVFTQRVWAETGGYPYADYNGPGSDASQYLWTDASGQWYSEKYRFAYRNCTDFVAWKLDATNGWYVGVSMGHAKDWGSWATNPARNYRVDMSPAPGAVAWWDANAHGMSDYGHVAWVKAVDGDTVTIEEYNNPGGGTWGSRSFHKSKVSGYIHFQDLDGGRSTTPPPPTSHYVIRLKKTSFGSAQQIWTATKNGVYVDEWWPGSGGIVHSKVYTARADEQVVDFDKINQPDGATQSLYIATQSTVSGHTGGVYEVWWRGQGYSDPAKLVTLPSIRKVIADLKQEKSRLTHRLYVLAQDGPYEYWWRDDTGVSAGYRLWNIDNGIAMIKSVAANGADEVYVATRDYVYGMVWPVNGAILRRQVTHLADTVDIAKQSIGNTELLYTATATGVHETNWKWQPGTGTWTAYSSPAKIVTISSSEPVVRVEKALYGSTQQLYIGTIAHGYQFYWNASTGGVKGGPPLITVAPGTLTDMDMSVDPNNSSIQQLYTAQKSLVYETWWGDGAVHNGVPIVSLPENS